MALIEIDGLPIKNGGSFHGELLIYQGVAHFYKRAENEETPAEHSRTQKGLVNSSVTTYDSTFLILILSVIIFHPKNI